MDLVLKPGARMAKKSVKHVGFKAAAKQVAKSYGGDMKIGAKVIAAGARKASPAAKKRNPKLKKVMGAGGSRKINV